jgi:hypothetical protein
MSSSPNLRNEYDLEFLMEPHPKQWDIINSPAKRKIIRAGRRSGKTVVAAILAIFSFLRGGRPLYAAPTADQLHTFWNEVKNALWPLIQAGIFAKNETEHTIERTGTKQRIKGKTAWNSDMLRGDYSDLLIVDEFQLVDEKMWDEVGAPMLLDNNGDAVFIYTPPSLHTRSVSKARDPRHAGKMFEKALNDPRWEAFHFTSHDNPYISHDALEEITFDMSSLAYRQEIMAEDVDEVVGALWNRELIAKSKVSQIPDMARIVVGVDPPGGATECGIVVAGLGMDNKGYVLGDYSLAGSPNRWASGVIRAYIDKNADMIVGEQNYGGDMVKSTIMGVAKEEGQAIRYRHVTATRGKAVRAEPIVAGFEQGRIYLVGDYPYLEDELCQWIPGESKLSPNRLDAMVWALTELMVVNRSWRPLEGTKKEEKSKEEIWYPIR